MTKRKNVEAERLTNPEEIAKNSKIHDIKPIKGHKKPDFKPKETIMRKIISFLKRGATLIAGVVGGGGSLLAGIDPATSVLIAVSAAMLVLGVELAVVKEFKELFDDE